MIEVHPDERPALEHFHEGGISWLGCEIEIDIVSETLTSVTVSTLLSWGETELATFQSTKPERALEQALRHVEHVESLRKAEERYRRNRREEIRELESELEDVNSEIEELKDRQDSLKSRIATIESELDL